MLTVSAGRDHLLRNGRPFCWVGDTAWHAFAGPTDEEWDYYLATRAEQGFTALQVSLLPIPRELSGTGWPAPRPFPVADDLGFDVAGPVDGAYLDRAVRMVAQATERGFVCMVALLWCDYLPRTWADERTAGRHRLDAQTRRELLETVVPRLAPYHPVFAVSGDADPHNADAATVDIYLDVLRLVRALAPDCLTTVHVTPRTVLPAALADADELDLCVYQSGHLPDETFALARSEAAHYRAADVPRPAINLEPCYEAHGHGFGYGRFTAADIRRISWCSLLAGAAAGIGYGAHGVFQWHRHGQPFASEAWSGAPPDWREALHLPGAWDLALLRDLVERYRLIGALPRSDALVDAPEEVVAAASRDGRHLAVYTPWPTRLRLAADVGGDRAVGWDLAERRPHRLAVTRDGDHAVVDAPRHRNDGLVVVDLS